MKPMAAVRRSVRCLSLAALTLQCAALRAARHFSSRDACHEHFCEGYSAPPGAGLFPPAGGVTFSPPKKSPKSRQNLRFWNPLFCERFHETNCRRAPVGTLFILSCTDGAMCRLPGGATFRRA